MSEKCNTITGVLQRSGTDQSQRNNGVLDPNSLELHGFGISEWMKFAMNFAKHVNYYSEDNSNTPNDDWQAFFSEFNDVDEFLKKIEGSNDLTPHLTLFICFLKLLELPKKRLNGLTKRHLDFFYSEVLKIDKIKERSDSAYVLFELAKSFDQERLTEGLQLDGGKDGNGARRIYELDQELAANQAKVTQLKSVYRHFRNADDKDNEKDGVDVNYYYRSSSVANSYDGRGADFPNDDKSWLPFGYYQNENSNSVEKTKLPFLEKAKVGFSVASPILNLSEGTRYVQFTIQFKEILSNFISAKELKSCIKVYYTAKSNWVGPLDLHTVDVSSKEIKSLNGRITKSLDAFSTLVDGAFVHLTVKLEPKAKPTSPFNDLIHFGRYNTEDPIFKFVIDVNTKNGAQIHQAFSKEIAGMDIHVGVAGMKQLMLDSDSGTLNPKKPMYPFTQNPVKGSSLIINSEEIFSKKWNLVNAEIKWKNTPDNFGSWYKEYSNNKQFGTGNITNDYFKANKYLKYNEEWELRSNVDIERVVLFGNPTSEKNFECSFSIENDRARSTEVGPIKISLETTFLHQIYPQLYTLAITNTTRPVVIPNQPYTPFADEIVVGYFAKESLNFEKTSTENFENRSVRLFHEHPFGQSEESDYLKKKVNAQKVSCSLVPEYKTGGELFIGLQNAEVLQTVSLLIQLQEGSENPLAQTFTTDGITWEILCSDHWRKLDSLSIVQNEIDNFLKSGLVKIRIPNEATSNNTQLDRGLYWIKAVLPKSFDAVSRVLSIQAQGVKATFVNSGNELSHLENGIPANTISKLVERSSQVKSVLQPYNSFGGKPKETDELYYKRVSERLRHKNRAIMLWDYENIILQEFTDIYKVKCLNHTNNQSYLAAGCVTVIVIPDTKNKNMFNIFKPRVSTARLNQVREHVLQLTSLHVNLEVINPKYEEVKIIAEVKFYDGYDDALYQIQLDTDLKKFLSPWAFDSNFYVEFGRTLHNSVLINFIEKLYYVDYVLSIKMKVSDGGFTKNCTPSTPKSILVSSEQHDIKAIKENPANVELTNSQEC